MRDSIIAARAPGLFLGGGHAPLPNLPPRLRRLSRRSNTTSPARARLHSVPCACGLVGQARAHVTVGGISRPAWAAVTLIDTGARAGESPGARAAINA